MKIKTQDLTGVMLDWAVAMAEGLDYACEMPEISGRLLYYAENGEAHLYQPSTDWSLTGPIIEREQINLIWTIGYPVKATIYKGGNIWFDADGPTPLTAAMRCYCLAKLGTEVEIPEELK